jgi:hypothetical protein
MEIVLWVWDVRCITDVKTTFVLLGNKREPLNGRN